MDNYASQNEQKTVTTAQPLPQQQQHIVIAAPPPPPLPSTFGRNSQQVYCQMCKKTVNTNVNLINGTMTHVVALALFCFTCCCCCVPYFVDGMKDAEHRCSQCNNFIGIDKKM